jgi:hypothetical protein
VEHGDRRERAARDDQGDQDGEDRDQGEPEGQEVAVTASAVGPAGERRDDRRRDDGGEEGHDASISERPRAPWTKTGTRMLSAKTMTKVIMFMVTPRANGLTANGRGSSSGWANVG